MYYSLRKRNGTMRTLDTWYDSCLRIQPTTLVLQSNRWKAFAGCIMKIQPDWLTAASRAKHEEVPKTNTLHSRKLIKDWSAASRLSHSLRIISQSYHATNVTNLHARYILLIKSATRVTRSFWLFIVCQNPAELGSYLIRYILVANLAITHW